MNPREAINRIPLVRAVEKSFAKDRVAWEEEYNQPTWDYPALETRGFHELIKAVGAWAFAPSAVIGGLVMIITGIGSGDLERVAIGVPAVVAGTALTEIAEKAFRHSRTIGKRIGEIPVPIGYLR